MNIYLQFISLYIYIGYIYTCIYRIDFVILLIPGGQGGRGQGGRPPRGPRLWAWVLHCLISIHKNIAIILYSTLIKGSSRACGKFQAPPKPRPSSFWALCPTLLTAPGKHSPTQLSPAKNNKFYYLSIALDAHMFSHSGYGAGTQGPGAKSCCAGAWGAAATTKNTEDIYKTA